VNKGESIRKSRLGIKLLDNFANLTGGGEVVNQQSRKKTAIHRFGPPLSAYLYTVIAATLFLNNVCSEFLATFVHQRSYATENVEKLNTTGFSPKTLSERELAEGWISLFDGETLYGWRAETDANWKVENGTITVDQGIPGLLRTSAQFDDFMLRVDFRSPKDTNSGIFIRTNPQPKDPAKDCYEINIADQGKSKFPTGAIVDRVAGKGGFDSENWQTYEITAIGDTIKIGIDGRQSAVYQDTQPLGRGYIGLQLNSGKVEFGNIFIKPLKVPSIFNGKDLAGWKTFPEFDSEFSVIEGDLHVKGGSGQLETAEKYGDFILQLECKTNAERLNSGIFFRCIPGEKMNGYECQIHNGFKDGDRTQPEDFGTGGIFRRQPARKVVADDLKWFQMTLIAEGPHFCAWVNGYQVSDWTDKREPDVNPRKGQRLEPGTIMIQGHDPTTDIDFRNIRAREMASRKKP